MESTTTIPAMGWELCSDTGAFYRITVLVHGEHSAAVMLYGTSGVPGNLNVKTASTPAAALKIAIQQTRSKQRKYDVISREFTVFTIPADIARDAVTSDRDACHAVSRAFAQAATKAGTAHPYASRVP